MHAKRGPLCNVNGVNNGANQLKTMQISLRPLKCRSKRATLLSLQEKMDNNTVGAFGEMYKVSNNMTGAQVVTKIMLPCKSC